MTSWTEKIESSPPRVRDYFSSIYKLIRLTEMWGAPRTARMFRDLAEGGDPFAKIFTRDRLGMGRGFMPMSRELLSQQFEDAVSSGLIDRNQMPGAVFDRSGKLIGFNVVMLDDEALGERYGTLKIHDGEKASPLLDSGIMMPGC